MKIEYATGIKNGKFWSETIDKLAIDLPHLEGKNITLIIEPATQKRSKKQNRYYFGCIIEEERNCFKERLGELLTKEEIHDWNKSKFFAKEVYDEYANEVLVFPSTSTRFSTLEFEEKLEMIRRYFETKFQWYIPAPNEQKLIFTNDQLISDTFDDQAC